MHLCVSLSLSLYIYIYIYMRVKHGGVRRERGGVHLNYTNNGLVRVTTSKCKVISIGFVNRLL